MTWGFSRRCAVPAGKEIAKGGVGFSLAVLADMGLRYAEAGIESAIDQPWLEWAGIVPASLIDTAAVVAVFYAGYKGTEILMNMCDKSKHAQGEHDPIIDAETGTGYQHG